jgi:hypothetical protein
MPNEPIRQINKEIAEDAAHREADDRAAIEWGVGLMIGGAAMGDPHAIKYLGLCAEIARLNLQHSGLTPKKPTPAAPSEETTNG